MNIFPFSFFTETEQANIKKLWEENTHELWANYNGSDMFAVNHAGKIVGGFAVTSFFPSAGTGIGVGAYFDGTNWIDEPGNLTNTGSPYIKITYLGQ